MYEYQTCRFTCVGEPVHGCNGRGVSTVQHYKVKNHVQILCTVQNLLLYSVTEKSKKYEYIDTE